MFVLHSWVTLWVSVQSWSTFHKSNLWTKASCTTWARGCRCSGQSSRDSDVTFLLLQVQFYQQLQFKKTLKLLRHGGDKMYKIFSKNLQLHPEEFNCVKISWERFYVCFCFFGFQVVLMHSTNTWLHTRKNTHGFTQPWLGCLLAAVSCSGTWWMVSKQKTSLRSEQQRDYEPMMDGSVSYIASLQHTAFTTQTIIPPKKWEKIKSFGRKHPPYTHWDGKITSHGLFKIHKLESCTWCVYCTAESVKI